MLFRVKLVALLIVFVGSLYCAENRLTEKNNKVIPNDINYTYNVSEIRFAKSSDGIWKNKKDYGYFTAIAYRTGLEHGYDLIRVLVKKAKFDEQGLGELVIIKDIQIDTPGIAGYISDMQLKIVNNKLLIGLDIQVRSCPDLTVKQSILVDINGTVTNLIPFNTVIDRCEELDTSK